MERRLAAILAADVVGYSRHTERNEEASTFRLRMYRAVVEKSISAHKGRIFSSAGDGVVAEFPSIVEAIRCAIEIQKDIRERNAPLPENDRMHFRIGVNLGDVITEDDNLYGTGVNVAVRLEQLAEPGGIFISQTVYNQVRKIVEIPFQDIGERRLKNIADPIHVYRILPAPLPWLKRFLSNIVRKPSFGFGITSGILVLLLAIGAGSFYLRQPATLWHAVLGHAGELSEKAAIAVLPFEDISDASQSQQYLADGITEELITGLAKFPEFVVLARKATERYKKSNEEKNGPTDIRQIGEDLNVDYIVTGSLLRSGQKVRVTAQLIDASTPGRQIWHDEYDRQEDNIFAIRDDITRGIGGQLGGLQGQVAKDQYERLRGKEPNSFTAYDDLQKGMHELYIAVNGDEEANTRAREWFEKARADDPNYARVYAGLAWTHAFDCDFEWIEKDDYDKTVKKALDMANKAVSLDRNDYQAYWVRGWASLYTRDPDKVFRQHDNALANYQRALELNPNDAELLAEMSNFLVYMGEPQKAIDQLNEAIRLNPNHEAWYIQYLGWAYEHAGMPSEAIATLQKPEAEVMSILEKLEQKEKSPEEEKETMEALDSLGWLLPTLAAAYAEVGRMADAQKIKDQILLANPEFSTAEVASRAPYKTNELRDRYVKALRQAGLPE